MKTHLLIVALALLNGSVNARGWVFPECTIDPPNPTSADAFTFTFGGVWFDTCVPDHLSVQVVKSSIRVDVHIQPEIPVCFDAETPWTLSGTIGPLPPGTYTVLGTLYYFDDPEPWYVDTPICDIVVSESEPACTPIGGLICEDTTWTAKDGPYCVTSSIVVGCGATLAIEPGAHVCFPRGQLGLAVGSGAFGEGTLVARGTSEAPITFTSCEPDPEPGDWALIHFTGFAESAMFDEDKDYLSGSILEYAIVEYAGAIDNRIFGAVTAKGSSPFIARNVIRKNASSGVFLFESESVRLLNNTISQNKGIRGGGIQLSSSPFAMIVGNSIANNSSEEECGGVLILESESASLVANTITGNSALWSVFGGGDGGGVLVRLSNKVTLTGNTISNNRATGSGGGVSITHSDSVTLIGNTIMGNTAPTDLLRGGQGGGGLYLGPSKYATLIENTITGNTAVSQDFGGGGILMFRSHCSTLRRNAIVRNWASPVGGGMALIYSDKPTIMGCVVAGNNSLTPSDGAAGVYVMNSPAVLLLPDGSLSVSLFANMSLDLWNDNGFGSIENDIIASNVWWGTQNANDIQSRIWDFFNDASKAFVVWDPPAPTGPFDFNGDGEILRDDLTDMAACLGGPDTPREESCTLGDLDRNGVVDLFDFATFQTVVRAP